MRTVLVAIDDSDASRRVADFVNRFFERSPDLDLIGVNVGQLEVAWVPAAIPWGGMYAWPVATYPPTGAVPATAAAEGEPSIDEQNAAARREAQERAAAAGLRDARATGEVGDPAEVILAAAEERDVDLIVMGTNHKGLLQRFLSPSVSREVLRQSDRPVLVVP